MFGLRRVLASPPWRRRERGFDWDLTQRAVIDRRDGLSLSKWRGHGVDFFSGLMGVLVFQVNVSFEEGFGFSPLGETGEGFVTNPFLCALSWECPLRRVIPLAAFRIRT